MSELIVDAFAAGLDRVVEHLRGDLIAAGVDASDVDPMIFAQLIEGAGRILGRETPGAAAKVAAQQERFLMLAANFERLRLAMTAKAPQRGANEH